MARTLYGLTGGDVVAQVSVDDGDFEPATAAMTVWDSFEDGTQITDLTSFGGSPGTTVTPDALGRAIFHGPDGFTDDLYLEDADGGRWLVRPADLTSRATGAGVPAGGTAGQFVRKQSSTDFDAEWESIDADDIGDGTANKAFTAAEKAKLGTIAESATANSSDAALLALANATGTLALSKIDAAVPMFKYVAAGASHARPSSESSRLCVWVFEDLDDVPASRVTSGTTGPYQIDLVTVQVTS